MTRIMPDDVPSLARGVRMHFDRVRQTHVLLAPERAFNLDQHAVAVLGFVDGQRRVSDIVDALSATYVANRSLIEADVLSMLSDLAGKRVLVTVRPPAEAALHESLAR